MFKIGWHLFAPKCFSREKIYRKHNHYLYVVKYFNTGVIEMWCHLSKAPQGYAKLRPRDVFLGTIVDYQFHQSQHFHDLYRNMQVMAQKVFEEWKEDDDKEGAGAYNGKMKKRAKKPVVYDRAYFVEQGKKGPEAVAKKYGVYNPVLLRWKKRKLSTRK